MLCGPAEAAALKHRRLGQIQDRHVRERVMSESVLIVEDDRRMNEILCDYFEMAGFNVLSACDGLMGLELFGKERVDLVLLDIMMPGLDGWSLCRRIRRTSDCLIIIISARSEEEDKLLGYELGADEYVAKPFSPRVLVAGASALLRRNRSREKRPVEASPSLVRVGEILVDRDSYKATAGNRKLGLTAKEFELLLKLMENPGKVFRRDALIQAIWGYDYFGDGRVVDTNIKTLRKKLGEHAAAIQTVIGIGYKFEVKQ